MLIVPTHPVISTTAYMTMTLSTIPTDYSKFIPISRVDYTSYFLLPDESSDDYVYQVYSSYSIAIDKINDIIYYLSSI